MARTHELITPRLRLYAPSLAEIELLRQGQRALFGARILGPGAATTGQFEDWWNETSLIRLLPRLVEEMRAHPEADGASDAARWVWLMN